MAAAVMVIIVRVVRVMAVVMAVVGVAVVMAPGKGFKKNPEKASLRRRERLLSGLPMQKGARVRVISAPIDTSPA